MLREKALEILRANSPYGIALENHCLRIAEFTVALGQKHDAPVDEDLVYAGAYLHDIGLCVKDPTENNYLRRNVKFVRASTEDWELSAEQQKILDEILLHNHSVKSVPNIDPQAELVRKAVLVEHSLGNMTHGLSKQICRQVFDKYPRYDFNRVLMSFFKTVLMEGGPTALFRVFLPQMFP